MTYISLQRSRRGLGAGRAIVLGTISVGVLDLVDALVFFGLRGVAPVRILQGIASGLLGRSAFQGGPGAAVLGLVLHFFIAFAIVTVYHLTSRRIRELAGRPWLCGPIYGVLVYLFMNLLVLPLSSAAPGGMTMPVMINGVLIHMFGVGLPAALFARAARTGR